MSSNWLLLAAALPVVGGLYIQNRKKTLPLPPGPRGLPLVGNIFDIPSSFPWETYAEWTKTYNSDILYANMAGTHIVILNTKELAVELLNKRPHIYSSRPGSYMAQELIGYKWMMIFQPAEKTWRAGRRLLNQHFVRRLDMEDARGEGNEWYRPSLTKYTHEFLQKVVEQPENFSQYITELTGSISLATTYGLNVQRYNDPYIAMSLRAAHGLGEALVPGRFWIDAIPWLRFAPSWVHFKQKAKEWHAEMVEYRDAPFRDAKKKWLEELKNETPYDSSFVTTALEAIPSHNSEEEDFVKETAGTLFMATLGTTSAALEMFFLAMMFHPEIQERAQAEVDRVVVDTSGTVRLPVHDDADKLPYCVALVLETLRWKPVGPIALPHLTTEEDVYEGMRIPKNAVVIENIWAMMHDERVWDNPSQFMPERFLNEDGSLNTKAAKEIDMVFSTGRRVCPGKDLSISFLKIFIMTVLTVFDLSKPLDEHGNPIEQKVEFESNITPRALPFKCTIKPRSKERLELVYKARQA